MQDDSNTTSIEVDADTAHGLPPLETENQDGTTTLLLDGEAPPSIEGDWFDNLVESLPEQTLSEIAERYLELIDQDREARKDRDKQYADGLKKAGLGSPAPGGADFDGASRVTHPVLVEAYVDFSASSIKELFPPNGPVRTKIDGKPNKQKMDRAKRKCDFMNWQLTREIPSYRPELERLLTQLPAGGSQYMKLYWDEGQGRPDAEFIPIDDIVLPYEARNFFDLQRKFHMMKLSQLTYERRLSSGLYVDYDLPKAYGGIHDDTDAGRQSDKIEGKSDDHMQSVGERLVYEGCIFDEIIEDVKAPEGKAVPYLITIDDESRKVLAIYRNWDEEDKNHREIEYMVDFTFIPWRGVFGIGLPQMIGDLSTAMTGALRALLDSALINTMPSGIKLKGLPSGTSNSISPTEIKELDGGPTDDIRKLYMATPFNPPSTVLVELLGLLTTAAKSVVGTAEEKISEASNQMPVGTALALIEQGAKVFSSIHARLHDSQRRCLEILHRLNRDHLPDKMYFGTDPDDYVTRQDFEGRMDVHPVSDPNIFSETQRFAQIQFVIQTVLACAPVLPQAIPLFDLHALFARAFEMAKIQDYEDFLPEQPKAKPLNPADENVDLVMGRPVKAYPGQNHEAHIQVLLDFAQNPLFGMSPIVAQKFGPGALNHLMDHLLIWYDEMMKAAASQGQDQEGIDWDNDPNASVELAKAAPVVNKAAEIAFAKIGPLVQQAMAKLQAMAPKPPVDPMVQVAMQEVQGKQQVAQAQLSLDQQKAQADAHTKMTLAQAKAAEAQQKAAAAQQDYKLEMQKMGLQAHTDMAGAVLDAQTSIRTANIQAQTDMAKTIHNNASAQKIAEMKIESDESTKLSDGASLNKGD